MAETLEGKKLVGSRSADKVMYYYKLISMKRQVFLAIFLERKVLLLELTLRR